MAFNIFEKSDAKLAEDIANHYNNFGVLSVVMNIVGVIRGHVRMSIENYRSLEERIKKLENK